MSLSSQPRSGESVFWLIWSPAGQTPPRERIDTETEANEVAKSMAATYPGNRFYVLKATAVALSWSVTLEELDDIPF